MRILDGGVVLLLILLFGGALYGMNEISDGQLVKDAKGVVSEVKDKVK
jgi:hypothetical protein